MKQQHETFTSEILCTPMDKIDNSKNNSTE